MRFFFSATIEPSKLIPLPPDHTYYNIISQHFVYDKQTISQLFGPDYLLITILRDPVDRFISGMNFIGWPKSLKLPADTPINSKVQALFAKLHTDDEFREWFMTQYSIVIDTMSSSLGAKRFMKEQNSQLKSFIEYADQELDLVLLQEFFDEGLLELGDLLGMEVGELIYVRENCKQNCAKSKPYSDSLSSMSKDLIQSLNPIDTALYNHFKEKHLNKRKSGRRMWQFQKQLETTFSECICGENTKGLFHTVSYELCPEKIGDRFCREIITDSLAYSLIVSERQSKGVTSTGDVMSQVKQQMADRHFLSADDFP